MPLSQLAVPGRVVGLRAVLRQLRLGRLEKVFLVGNAGAGTSYQELIEEAKRQGVEVEWVEEAVILGRACMIDRQALAAGIIAKNV